MLLLFNNAELISFLFQPSEYLGQGVLELVDAFERVVEGDDAAVSGVAFHVVHHVLGCEQTAVIARYDIPHHDFYADVSQDAILYHPNPAVRRSEEVGVEDVVGLLDVGKVSPGTMAKARDVVEGVIAYLMASHSHFVEQMRVLDGIVAHHEEGCLCSEAVEGVEDEGCCLGNGAVVEGEVDSLPVWLYPP